MYPSERRLPGGARRLRGGGAGIEDGGKSVAEESSAESSYMSSASASVLNVVGVTLGQKVKRFGSGVWTPYIPGFAGGTETVKS